MRVKLTLNRKESCCIPYPDLVIPALLHIQAHLEEDLSLERVAAAAGASPYHFHRVFQEAVGETLKAYTQRLRLERAALHLLIHDAPVLEVALGNGYRSHETFTRAFKRQFGVTPSAYRNTYPPMRAGEGESGIDPQQEILNRYAGDYDLSAVHIVRLQAVPVIFLRNRGPYEMIEVTLYDRLIDWARENGHYGPESQLIGVALDPPGITPPDKLRFDACLSVSGTMQPDPPIGYQVLAGGYHAFASYVGPFGPTMEAAYLEISQAAAGLKRVKLVGLPSLEFYRTTQIDPAHQLNHTDIYLPVEQFD